MRILLFLFSLSTTITPMKGMDYLFAKNEYEKYQAGTNYIDSIAKATSGFAIWFIHTTHKKRKGPINYNFYQKTTQERIKHIHHKLLEDEKKIITDIFDDFDLNEKQRQETLLFIDKCKKENTKYLTTPNPETISHDIFSNNIQRNILETTGIDVRNIKIITNPDSEWAAAAGIVRDSSFCKSHNHLINRAISYVYSITSSYPHVYYEQRNIIFKLCPTITLYSPFFNNLEEQYAITLHEIAHIKCHHHITTSILAWAVIGTSFNNKTLYSEYKNFEKLRINHEAQAEILYKNTDGAHAMRLHRKRGYYPNTLFLKHYAQLAIIDELHQFPEKLKAYKPTSIQKIKFPRISTLDLHRPFVCDI